MGMSSRRMARWIAALSSVAAFAPLPAWAQEAASERYGVISIYRYPSKDAAGVLRPVLAIGKMRDWVSAADYPADAVAAKTTGSVRVRVSVDASDAVTNCVVEESKLPEQLQLLACRIIRERGRFRHALSTKGKPIASDTYVEFHFAVMATPNLPIVPPPAPPMPRATAYAPSWRMTKEPNWRVFAPPGTPDGDVVVSLTLYPTRQAIIQRRYCYPEVSSGNLELDRATCEAVKTAVYVPLDAAGRGYSPVLMLVRWRKGTATIEFPSRPRVTPFALADAKIDPAVPAGLITQRAWIEVTFNANGKAMCHIDESTGSDRADIMICDYFRTRVRFTPQIDLFGRKVPVKRYYHFDP